MAETPHRHYCGDCGLGLPDAALRAYVDADTEQAAIAALRSEAQDTAASSGLRGIRQAIIDAIALMGHVVNDSTGEAVNSALIADAALALAQPTPEPCYRVAPNPLNEYAVTYCETHDQPADQCHSTPEPSLRDALAKEHATLRGPAHAAPNGWYANGKYDSCSICRLLSAQPLRQFSEALDGAVQAALPAQSVAEKVWQDRNDRWVPLAAVESAARGLPCPMRSSITDQPCILPWGHPPDIGRFHRFERALSAQPSEPGETEP